MQLDDLVYILPYIFVSFPTSSSLFRLHSPVSGSLCLASFVPFSTLFFCFFLLLWCLHCNSKWKHAAFRRCFVVKIKFNTRAYQLIATSPSIELNWQQIASTYTTIKHATVLLLLVAARDNVFNRISIVAWSSLIFSAQHFASNFSFDSTQFNSVQFGNKYSLVQSGQRVRPRKRALAYLVDALGITNACHSIENLKCFGFSIALFHKWTTTFSTQTKRSGSDQID